MLGLVIELGIRSSFWIIGKALSGVYYLCYGSPETSEKRIMLELEKIKTENRELRESIANIRTSS